MKHFTTNITYLIFQEMMTCYLKPFFVPDHCVFQTDELMKRLRLMDMCNKQMGHRSVEKAIIQEHRLQFSTLIQEDTDFIQKKIRNCLEQEEQMGLSPLALLSNRISERLEA